MITNQVPLFIEQYLAGRALSYFNSAISAINGCCNLILSDRSGPSQTFSTTAGFYSQLAGVLAGFAFAALTALFASRLAKDPGSTTALQAARPLAACLIGLIATSLNYAVVAGEASQGLRAAALETSAGLGFSVAGIMLFYSLYILSTQVESSNEGDRRTYRHNISHLLQGTIVFAVSPLLTLLMFGGTADYLALRYADWQHQWLVPACIVIEAVSIAGSFSVLRYFGRRPSKGSEVGAVSVAAIGLSVMSVVLTTIIQIFTSSSWDQTEYLPLAEIMVVLAFAMYVCSSSVRPRT